MSHAQNLQQVGDGQKLAHLAADVSYTQLTVGVAAGDEEAYKDAEAGAVHLCDLAEIDEQQGNFIEQRTDVAVKLWGRAGDKGPAATKGGAAACALNLKVERCGWLGHSVH